MAKTVGLPVAIAAKLILSGEIKSTGVKIPTSKDIYIPVLKELADNGINFIEPTLKKFPLLKILVSNFSLENESLNNFDLL